MVNLAKVLELTRPLAVMDLETTGFDEAEDRIWQIGLTLHYPTKDPIVWVQRFNPQHLIFNTPEFDHGVTNEELANEPVFSQYAKLIASRLLDVDFAGYNVTFDIRFLMAEMSRAGVSWPWKGCIVYAYRIWKAQCPHDLTHAYREFGGPNGEPVNEDFADAHDAGADVAATGAVLNGQLLRWPMLPRTVAGLQKEFMPDRENAIDLVGKFIWVGEEPCITFGKHASNGPFSMRKVPPDYWGWMLGQDFAEEVKTLARQAKRGVFPKRVVEDDSPF